MKITIYELLGLVKDGKAPEKIKYKYSIYELTPEKNEYYCKNEIRWFTNEIDSLGVLNDYVEITEEPKKIKKIKQLNNVVVCKELIDLENIQQINNHILKDKINELIDEINNLKENN